MAVKVLGAPEKAVFTIKEMLPLLSDDKTNEAFELMWKLYKEGKVKP
jgi:hypothetical protein